MDYKEYPKRYDAAKHITWSMGGRGPAPIYTMGTEEDRLARHYEHHNTEFELGRQYEHLTSRVCAMNAELESRIVGWVRTPVLGRVQEFLKSWSENVTASISEEMRAPVGWWRVVVQNVPIEERKQIIKGWTPCTE